MYAPYAALDGASEVEAARLVHEYITREITTDLRCRGAKGDRIATFLHRIHAVRCLVDAFEGILTVSLGKSLHRPRVDGDAWAVKRPANLVERVWPRGPPCNICF